MDNKDIVQLPPENQTESKKSPLHEARTRRAFLRLGGLSVVALATAVTESQREPSLVRAALSWILGNKPKEDVTPKAEINPKPNYERLNSIIERKLGTEERRALELQCANDANSLEQIDTGLEVVTDPELRIKLLDKRWQIRLDGPEEITGLRKPTQEELDWCNKPHKADKEKKKIHPEELMRDTDDFFLALKDLEDKEIELEKMFPGQGRRKLLEIFRQDLLEEEIKNVEGKQVGRLSTKTILAIPLINFLINPGAMLGVRFHESRALSLQNDHWYMGINIGKQPVEDFIHGDLLNSYNLFLEALSEAGPLKYPSRSILGSEKSADIGSNQFSVETLWNHFKFLRNNFKIIFNPIGISARAAYLFLGRGAAWTDTNTGKRIVQKGYVVGDKLDGIDLETEFKKPALNKQNETLTESNFQWAQEYNEDIVKTGVFARDIIPWYRKNKNVKAATY